MGFQKGNQLAKGNPNSGRPALWTQEKIEAEASYLLEWSKQDDSLVLAECYGLRGYSYDHVSDWEKKNSVFAEAKKIAKTRIGARREKKALLNQIDSNIVGKTLITYDPEFRAAMKELSHKGDSSNQPIINLYAKDFSKISCGETAN